MILLFYGLINVFCLQIDAKKYIRDYIIGARTYLLKEKPETLPKARANLKKLYYLDKFVTILFYGLVVFFIYSYLRPFSNAIKDIFDMTRDFMFPEKKHNISDVFQGSSIDGLY